MIVYDMLKGSLNSRAVEMMHMDIKAIFNVYMLVLCYMIYLVPKICPINMKYFVPNIIC